MINVLNANFLDRDSITDSVIYHELGHAAVASFLGIDTVSIAFSSLKKDKWGSIKFLKEGSFFGEKISIISLSGILSEAYFTKRLIDFTFLSDLEVFDKVCNSKGLSSILDYLNSLKYLDVKGQSFCEKLVSESLPSLRSFDRYEISVFILSFVYSIIESAKYLIDSIFIVIKDDHSKDYSTFINDSFKIFFSKGFKR